MNEELLLAGAQVLDTLLQRAAIVSTRMANGTLTREFLDELEVQDDAARVRQVEARDRAQQEGR
jgi:hypothetical protein